MGRIRQAGILVATNKLRSLAPYVEIVMWPNSRLFCVNLLPVKFYSCKFLVVSQLWRIGIWWWPGGDLVGFFRDVLRMSQLTHRAKMEDK